MDAPESAGNLRYAPYLAGACLAAVAWAPALAGLILAATTAVSWSRWLDCHPSACYPGRPGARSGN